MFFYKNIVIGCALGFMIWWLSEKGQDDLETISKIAKVLAIILIIISIFQQVMMIANYI